MRIRLTTIVALSLALIALNVLPAEASELRGATPGFWKQEQHFDIWPDGMEPCQELDQYFMFPKELRIYTPTDDLLIDALRYKGGRTIWGGARILLRHGVAALLNAEKFGKFDEAKDGGGYFYSADEVIDLVNAALASLDRGEMLSLAEELDFYNNQGYNN